MKPRLLSYLLIFVTLNSCIFGISSAQFELNGADVGTLTFNIDSTVTYTQNLAAPNGQDTSAYYSVINAATEA
jgi:hypothetical protein